MKFLPSFLVVLILTTSVLTAPVPKTVQPTRLTESYMLGEWKLVGDSDWKGTLWFNKQGKGETGTFIHYYTDEEGKLQSQEGWWEVYNDKTLQIFNLGYYLFEFDLSKYPLIAYTYPLRNDGMGGKKRGTVQIVLERK